MPTMSGVKNCSNMFMLIPTWARLSAKACRPGIPTERAGTADELTWIPRLANKEVWGVSLTFLALSDFDDRCLSSFDRPLRFGRAVGRDGV